MTIVLIPMRMGCRQLFIITLFNLNFLPFGVNFKTRFLKAQNKIAPFFIIENHFMKLEIMHKHMFTGKQVFPEEVASAPEFRISNNIAFFYTQLHCFDFLFIAMPNIYMVLFTIYKNKQEVH